MFEKIGKMFCFLAFSQIIFASVQQNSVSFVTRSTRKFSCILPPDGSVSRRLSIDAYNSFKAWKSTFYHQVCHKFYIIISVKRAFTTQKDRYYWLHRTLPCFSFWMSLVNLAAAWQMTLTLPIFGMSLSFCISINHCYKKQRWDTERCARKRIYIAHRK